MTVEVEGRPRRPARPSSSEGSRQIMRAYSGGYARTTVQQNLVLRWVREESVYDVWQALSELGLGAPARARSTDVVSCPGTDSCKLGITSSMGLNQAVQERIEAMQIDDELTRRMNIKISGCPNGCGQHHVGNIGFYGASIKVGEHTIPAYIPHVGGVFEGGRGHVRHAAEAAPAGEARSPRRSSDGFATTRPTATMARSGTTSSTRVGTARAGDAGQGPLAAGRLQPGDHEPVHRLEPERPLPGDPGRGRVRRIAV